VTPTEVRAACRTGPGRGTGLPPHQRDSRWWSRQISAAVAERDERLSNLRVTAVHHQLSEAMRLLLGPDSGANFHSWAVWGSMKAGVTIRRKDFQQAFRNGVFDRSRLGRSGGRLLARLCGDPVPGRPRSPALGMERLGVALGRRLVTPLAERARARARTALRAANRSLLAVTGGHTARFLEAFHAAADPEPQRLRAYLAGFRPGPPRRGGEDALRAAYRRYHESLFEADPGRRRALTYFANVLIISWEMTLLQPYFHRAVPRGPAAVVMPFFSTYEIGPRRLDMRQDVPRADGPAAPVSLRTSAGGDLETFLVRSVGRRGVRGRLGGTRLRPLIDPRRRLRYLFALTRVLHGDPAVLETPYSREEMDDIGEGRVPVSLA
jgi:hypothetical protein